MHLPRPSRTLMVTFVCSLAITAVPGGMAELGRKQTLHELAGSDVAVGGGIVELTADSHVFSRSTSAGNTVDSILELLEGDINASATGLVATHSAGAFVIGVTHPPALELTQLRIRTTDPGFGYVKATRVSADTRGSVRAVTEAAKGTDDIGDPSRIRIVVTDSSDHEVLLTLSVGETPASINGRIVTALGTAGFPASLSGGEIVMPNGIRGVLWEDNDQRTAASPGIVSIGATSDCPPVAGGGIPALSLLGGIALVTLLAAAAVWRLQAA